MLVILIFDLSLQLMCRISVFGAHFLLITLYSLSQGFDLALFYMGGRIFPQSIIAQQSSLDAPNGLIFHDFVPSNIRKVLERPCLEIVLKISKIFASTIFSELNPKGGPFYAKVKKSKKSNFFCSKSYFFYLNMNYKCSKLSIEVSDMPYNQFLVILRTFL